MASQNQGVGTDFDELIFVLEELEDYLKMGNLRGVTLAFTALKYLAEHFNDIKIDLIKLAEIISEVVGLVRKKYRRKAFTTAWL